jgi:hypothetical protein
MVGVRIKLSVDPFKRYGNSIVPVEEIYYRKDYFVQPVPLELIEISYTNDKLLLKPQFAELHSPKEITFNLNALGKYKSKVWKFEKEWRYMFWIFPKPMLELGKGSYSDAKFAEDVENFGKKQIPFNRYPLNIRDEALEQMEIMLGPKHSDSDVAIVEALINAYNPKAKFKPSKLTVKIRK